MITDAEIKKTLPFHALKRFNQLETALIKINDYGLKGPSFSGYLDMIEIAQEALSPKPESIPNSHLDQESFQDFVNKIASAHVKRREQWLTSQMEKLVPGGIFAQRKYNPKACSKWMEENGYYLEYRSNGDTALMKGDSKISILRAPIFQP